MFSQFEPTLDDNETKLFANIGRMNAGFGYDCVIVVCSTPEQEQFWQQRLENTVDQVTKSGAVLQAVTEDWEGGAGNGLGSLYAFQKARAAVLARDGDYSKDILNMMKAGQSVAMYHTAGKGTRIAPLGLSECNNKPGVKLPANVDINGEKLHMTILEATILSTAPYAKSRGGRLSVFWGDQVFVPQTFAPSGSHAADILAFLGPQPTEETWAEKKLSNYGLIAVDASGNAVQIEKAASLTEANATLTAAGVTATRVGASLGSFSVNFKLLEGLLEEFKEELSSKKGQMDSDPHLWMPLTLPEATYASAMESKGRSSASDAIAHHKRMAAFKAAFIAENGPNFFGAVDAGSDVYYWDFGQLALFFKHSMTVLDAENHGYALRKFFGIPFTAMELDSNCRATDLDEDSLFMTTELQRGKVERSLVVGCIIHEVNAENSLLINVTAKKINAKNAFLYNVFDDSEEGITVNDGEVVCNIFNGSDSTVTSVRSTLDTDGGKEWNNKVHGNSHSFSELYAANQGKNVIAAFAKYGELQSAHGFLRNND